ncbi:MAG: uroporphyrinogen-III synthase [Hydrogenophaga sp.]|nr:uroporphyrinogen-III synthase [Hydrogenophaga sp.]
MRVLVTRPEPAASRTAAELRRRGHEPLLLPLAVAEHDVDILAAALARPHAAIAVTSAEAIRALHALPDLPPEFFDMACFAVGESTASAAWNLGFRSVVAGDNNGTTLARMIAGQTGPAFSPDRPLIYLAGSPRASGFETELAALEVPVEICECYRMRPLAPSSSEIKQVLGTDPVDVILLYSSESARRLFDLPLPKSSQALLAGARILCLSKKIAGVVPEPLRSRTQVAPAPTEASLLSLL